MSELWCSHTAGNQASMKTKCRHSHKRRGRNSRPQQREDEAGHGVIRFIGNGANEPVLC